MVAAHDAADLHVDGVAGREHLADRRSVQRAARVHEEGVGGELAAGRRTTACWIAAMTSRSLTPVADRLDAGADAEVGDVRGAAQVLDLGGALDQAQVVERRGDVDELGARQARRAARRRSGDAGGSSSGSPRRGARRADRARAGSRRVRAIWSSCVHTTRTSGTQQVSSQSASSALLQISVSGSSAAGTISDWW